MAVIIRIFKGFLFSAMVCAISSDKIVLTNSGPVRGIKVKGMNSEAEAFLGIPYAEPPVGELRFRRPVPVRPWSDVYNATEMPFPCCQNATTKMYWMPDTENMTEDCLYLNVWVPTFPNENSTKKMTVMVWIHGGAFNIGSSNMGIYDGAQLATYGKIIVVSINYRLGVFGFLTALVDDANGNMGMYDQVQAMKWLKENVEAFGGDPEEIVLFGESAGAMAITIHLCSPLTRNLFNRAILQSGSGLSPLSDNGTSKLIETSNRIAKIVGCADRDMNISTHPQRVVDCLKRVPFLELTQAEGKLMTTLPLTFYPRWGDEYMPFDSLDAIKGSRHKNTEVLLGINEDEGSLFLIAGAPDYFGTYGKNGVERISKRMAKSLIKLMFQTVGENNVNEVADFYIGNVKNETSSSLRKAIFEAVGDYFITCGAKFFADLYSRNNNQVYFYIFTHRPSTTVLAEWAGATHFDEIAYVFGNPMNHGNFTSDEETLSRRIMDRWITFAKTGNPNIPNEINWHPYTYKYPAYLKIDIEEEMKKYPTNKRCEFWRYRFGAQINSSDETAERLVDDSNSSSDTKLTMLPHIAGIVVFFRYIT